MEGRSTAARPTISLGFWLELLRLQNPNPGFLRPFGVGVTLVNDARQLSRLGWEWPNNQRALLLQAMRARALGAA